MSCSSCYFFAESRTSDFGQCIVFNRQVNVFGDDDKGCDYVLRGRPTPCTPPAPQPSFDACASCESAARRKIKEQEATIATIRAELSGTRMVYEEREADVVALRSDLAVARAELAVARADLNSLRARLSRIRDEAVKP